jgi:hypothetical protein
VTGEVAHRVDGRTGRPLAGGTMRRHLTVRLTLINYANSRKSCRTVLGFNSEPEGPSGLQ